MYSTCFIFELIRKTIKCHVPENVLDSLNAKEGNIIFILTRQAMLWGVQLLQILEIPGPLVENGEMQPVSSFTRTLIL